MVLPVNAMMAGRALPGLGELARALRSRRGLSGCPDYAPYESPGGGCSNVPADVNAHAYFQSGGKLDEESQTIVGWDGGGPTLACPFGSELNPFTGRTECKSETEVKYTTSSGYVRRSGPQAAMADIAAAAQREAAARGITVRCGAYPVGGDPITNEQVYAPGCVVGNGVIGGPDTFSAAEMLTGGGMETLATQLGLSPFFKPSAGYQYTPPTSQQSAYQQMVSAGASAPPAGPVAPSPGVVRSQPATVSQPSANATAPNAPAALAIAEQAVEAAKSAIGGASVPSWVWLAGAGAIGLFLIGGRR